MRHLILWVEINSTGDFWEMVETKHLRVFFTQKRKLKHLFSTRSLLYWLRAIPKAINFPTKQTTKSPWAESPRCLESEAFDTEELAYWEQWVPRGDGQGLDVSLQPKTGRDKLELWLCHCMRYDFGQTRSPSKITHCIWLLFYLPHLHLAWFAISLFYYIFFIKLTLDAVRLGVV